ncbi:MAG: hypothetical protein MJ087_03140 [Lachnospiraceae bacterium]|nr:hypothetical protein [Lachnospiraceae bacterium]
MRENTKKIVLAVCVFALVVGLGWLYFTPYQLHAEFLPNTAIYESDPISNQDFNVYTSSRLGRKVTVKDFRLNSNTVSNSGLVAITSEKPKMGTLVDLNSISVVASEISFNEECREDFAQRYDPKIEETVYFEDGTVKHIKLEDDRVTYKVDQKKDRVNLQVDGDYNQYADSFELITIKSITTDSKVLTTKELNSKNLKLVAHYSDGSTKKLNNTLVKSKVVNNPKKGDNFLKCSYNGEDYMVKVKGYDPAKQVTFKKYGTFTLKHSKKYYVPGASRLNSWIGVRYFDNHRETYYSQRARGFAGKGLRIPGRHVAEDGTIRDKDGYICVASDLRYRKRYSVVMTTLGPGKVYDTGCAYGTIDLYVDW